MSPFAADLFAYVLQISLLLGVGLLLPVLFRLRDARVSLLYGQGLLAALLLLPLLQPEPVRASFGGETAVVGEWLAEAGTRDSGSLPGVVLAVLGLGVLLRLAWLGLGLRTLRSWRRGSRPAELAPEVAEIAGGTRAALLQSARVESPVTFGWRRPVVLLPAGFQDLPLSAQRGILCHELLHVRRRDWLATLFEEGVRALLWFHPGVWVLLARIALSREQVVDREAVRLTGSRRAYLEALRAFATGSRQAAVPGLPFFHRGHLRERVTHLCKEVPMSRPRTATLVTTFAGLLALTAVLGILAFPMAGAAWAKPVKVEGDVKPPKIVKQVPPAYPESAKEDRIEGTVVLTTVIDEQGRVQNPTVAQSSGNADLDRSAVDSVVQWTFQPATLDGKPVEVYYTLTIRFTLDN